MFCMQTGALLRAAHEGDLDKVTALLQEGVPVDAANSVRLRHLWHARMCLDLFLYDQTRPQTRLHVATHSPAYVFRFCLLMSSRYSLYETAYATVMHVIYSSYRTKNVTFVFRSLFDVVYSDR